MAPFTAISLLMSFAPFGVGAFSFVDIASTGPCGISFVALSAISTPGYDEMHKRSRRKMPSTMTQSSKATTARIITTFIVFLIVFASSSLHANAQEEPKINAQHETSFCQGCDYGAQLEYIIFLETKRLQK